MDIKLTLESKQIFPSVVNLKQYSTDGVLKYYMEEYIYESYDLSTMDCYAVCDMNGTIDEVKLQTEIVNEQLRITWEVSAYTTQTDGHLTYQIVFKDINNELAQVWFSHQGLILVSESINADGYIAAKYPTILQQWEQRMNALDEGSDTIIDSAEMINQSLEEIEAGVDYVKKAEKGIRDLLGEETTDVFGQEVVQARGTYPLLGSRLDAIELSIGSGSSVDELQNDVEDLKTEIVTKENKANYQLYTMLASNWIGNVYNFEAPYPSTTFDIDIQPIDVMTKEQLEAWSGAMIVGKITENKATAYGDVPTIDIPIMVKVVKK